MVPRAGAGDGSPQGMLKLYDGAFRLRHGVLRSGECPSPPLSSRTCLNDFNPAFPIKNDVFEAIWGHQIFFIFLFVKSVQK